MLNYTAAKSVFRFQENSKNLFNIFSLYHGQPTANLSGPKQCKYLSINIS